MEYNYDGLRISMECNLPSNSCFGCEHIVYYDEIDYYGSYLHGYEIYILLRSRNIENEHFNLYKSGVELYDSIYETKIKNTKEKDCSSKNRMNKLTQINNIIK